MRRKQTKIVATISDRKCDEAFIKSLYECGMDVVRVNTAHQSPEDTKRVIENVRAVSDQIGILIDTKGPEVRTSNVEEPVEFVTGDTVEVRCDDYAAEITKQVIQVSYTNFVNEVPADAEILIDDGHISLKVVEKRADALVCKVLNDGVISGRKSVNVPGVTLSLEALTKKDKDYVNFAIQEDVEFIAHSFVRNKEDVLAIQQMLDEAKSKVKIIAKIENSAGVENISEILDHVYGVMVARGDLGVEMPAEEVPIVQKHLVAECRRRGKPVIVATQMLQHMIDHPKPTRAEVNDVATAIFDGADAIMLSGETAYGKYPVEAVTTMSKVAQTMESSMYTNGQSHRIIWKDEVDRFIAQRAIEATRELPIKAIVTTTRTGATARIVSAYRAVVPIFAKCTSQRTVRELALVHGVYPTYFESQKNTDQLVLHALEELVQHHDINREDLVVILGTSSGEHYGIDFLEIKTVDQGITLYQ